LYGYQTALIGFAQAGAVLVVDVRLVVNLKGVPPPWGNVLDANESR